MESAALAVDAGAALIVSGDGPADRALLLGRLAVDIGETDAPARKSRLATESARGMC